MPDADQPTVPVAAPLPPPEAVPAANAAPVEANPAPTPAPAPARGRGRGGAGQATKSIFYDSDFGRDIDTVLALAVLSNLGNKGRLAAISVSNSSLEAAALCDSVRRFYAGAPVVGGRGGGGGMIVGLSEKGAKLDVPLVSKTLRMIDADGNPLFPHSINEVNDTAYPIVVLRNGLLTLGDGEATFILAGPATNLIDLLTLGRAPELLASKVSVLLVAAGTYPGGAADPRIRADVAAAKKLFAAWPTPIVAVGTEVGAAVPYPAQSIEQDFAWAPAHPVVEAYKANQPMPYDAPTQAVIAALYAADSSADYFHLSEPGTISVADDGKTTFARAADGKHRYLMVDVAQKERIAKDFTTLASAKPAPPQGRGRRGA